MKTYNQKVRNEGVELGLHEIIGWITSFLRRYIYSCTIRYA
jgi:hypothetical protein